MYERDELGFVERSAYKVPQFNYTKAIYKHMPGVNYAPYIPNSSTMKGLCKTVYVCLRCLDCVRPKMQYHDTCYNCGGRVVLFYGAFFARFWIRRSDFSKELLNARTLKIASNAGSSYSTDAYLSLSLPHIYPSVEISGGTYTGWVTPAPPYVRPGGYKRPAIMIPLTPLQATFVNLGSKGFCETASSLKERQVKYRDNKAFAAPTHFDDLYDDFIDDTLSGHKAVIAYNGYRRFTKSQIKNQIDDLVYNDLCDPATHPPNRLDGRADL